MSKEQLSEIKTIQIKDDANDALGGNVQGISQKPLLNLDISQPTNPLQIEWRTYEAEIDQRISKRTRRNRKEIIVGHNNIPIFKDRGVKRKPKISYTISRFGTLRPLVDILTEEVEDERLMIETFVSFGDRACKLLGGHEISALTQMLGKVGMEGEVYYVTSTPHLRDKLFENLLNFFASLRIVKGEDVNLRAISGEGFSISELLSEEMAHQLENFLVMPFTTDLNFYQKKYQDLGELREGFYHRFPIIPLQHQSPPLPPEISSSSTDVVVILERFSRVSERKKEEFLGEVDRILRPGGRLLIRENAQHQTEIEYYGLDIFKNYHRMDPPKGIKHRARWMIYQKPLLGASIDPSLGRQRFQVDANERLLNQRICSDQHRWNFVEDPNDEKFSKQLFLASRHMLTRRHEINGEVTDNYLIENSLREKLSLSWFKRVGLLSQLLIKFQGNIDLFVDFVISHNNAKQQTEENTQVEFKSRPAQSENPNQGAKPYYTIPDLAKEFSVKSGTIIKALRKGSGIKTQKVRDFNARAIRAKQLQFLYEEYLVVKDFLRRQNLSSESSTKKKESKNND